MTWLTWRQLRLQAATAFAAVAAAAVVLLATYGGLPEAGPSVYDQLTATDRNLYYGGVILLAVAPALLGAFWGAPLVARELEAGTHQLVWNQSVTRGRWLAAKLGLAVLATAVAVGLLSLVVTWWSGALDGAQASTRGSTPSRITPVAYAMRGIVPVGYAVLALVVGVLAGILLRRTVPAMAATLALVVFAQVAAPLWVRPLLASPVRQTVVISQETLAGVGYSGDDDSTGELTVAAPEPGAWVLVNRTLDPAGRPVAGLPPQIAECFPGPSAGGPRKLPDRSRFEGCFTAAAAAGYRQEVAYQPVGRFWRLQWTETAAVLGLSALLAWLCFGLVRRLS